MLSALRLIQDSGSAEMYDLRQMQNRFAGELSLEQALEQAQQIMETLPYPAIVVTHTLQVQAANAFFLRLHELPSLDTLPPHQRTMIHFLLMQGKKREKPVMWQSMMGFLLPISALT